MVLGLEGRGLELEGRGKGWGIGVLDIKGNFKQSFRRYNDKGLGLYGEMVG